MRKYTGCWAFLVMACWILAVAGCGGDVSNPCEHECAQLGDTRCEGGNAETCIEGADACRVWDVTECQHGCVVDNEGRAVCAQPEICTLGATRCNASGNLETCNAEGSAWEETVCSSGCEVDNQGHAQCKVVCSPGETRCSADSTAVETCQANGTWLETESCANGCANGACICAQGQTRCNDADNVETCNASEEWVETEQCEHGCNAGVCDQPTCTEGQTRCSDDGDVETCQSDAWVVTRDCEYGCTDGVCDHCPQGQTRCNDAGNVETCQANGEWTETEVCSNGCVAGACVCTPGETRCNEAGNVETCHVSGVWNQTEICDDGCADGACLCLEGETRCSDSGNVETCQADGGWLETEVCANGCFDGECICTPGETRCNEADNVETCHVSGVWNETEICDQEGCEDGVCLCTPDETRCNDDGDVETCNGAGNAWAVTEDCHGAGCVGGACVVCTDGDTRCSDDWVFLETCTQDGTGWDPMGCQRGCIERPGEAACVEFVCQDIGTMPGFGQVRSGDNSDEEDWFTSEDCDSGSPGKDVCVIWEPPPTPWGFHYDINTLGSDYDTILQIRYAMPPVGERDCNDDDDAYSGTVQSRIVDDLDGTPIVIVVDAKDADAVGHYELNIVECCYEGMTRCSGMDLETCGPICDWSQQTCAVDCAQPNAQAACLEDICTDLGSALGPGVATGDSTALGNDFDQLASCQTARPSGPDICFYWEAPADGTYVFDTQGSDYDTMLSAHDSDFGSELDCNVNAPFPSVEWSQLTLNLGQGQIIALVLDGFDQAQGSYVLSISP
ncbi:MAG: hypothetical protein JXR96_07955 [Deltaproteobacteria bacterium]|nr:hypothetical protein [Deltaproteobacteria bacterium]